MHLLDPCRHRMRNNHGLWTMGRIFPPSFPKSPMVCRPVARAWLTASATLGEFPEVDIPISASPFLLMPLTCFSNIASKP